MTGYLVFSCNTFTSPSQVREVMFKRMKNRNYQEIEVEVEQRKKSILSANL